MAVTCVQEWLTTGLLLGVQSPEVAPAQAEAGATDEESNEKRMEDQGAVKEELKDSERLKKVEEEEEEVSDEEEKLAMNLNKQENADIEEAGDAAASLEKEHDNDSEGQKSLDKERTELSQEQQIEGDDVASVWKRHLW